MRSKLNFTVTNIIVDLVLELKTYKKVGAEKKTCRKKLNKTKKKTISKLCRENVKWAEKYFTVILNIRLLPQLHTYERKREKSLK